MAEQELSKPLPATMIIALAKFKCPVQFLTDHGLVIEGCQFANGNIEAGTSLQIFTMVVNNTTKRPQFEEHKVVRQLDDDMSTIVSTEAPQKSSEDEKLVPNIVETVSCEK